MRAQFSALGKNQLRQMPRQIRAAGPPRRAAAAAAFILADALPSVTSIATFRLSPLIYAFSERQS